MDRDKFLKQYEEFCESCNNEEDYIWDEIHEFFGRFSRSEMCKIVEIIKNR
mgnify:CR=1 FL=1|jgi:hemerythrin superfamily protein